MAETDYLSCGLCSRSYTGTANRYPNSSGTESPAATHGTYSGTSWVGMVLIPKNYQGKKISSIKLTLTGNAAGTTASKTVYIWSSNYQTTSAVGKGSIYPKSLLGSISGKFRNNTVTVTLSGSLLSNVVDYLAIGGQMLILYDSTGSSSNYCRFTSISAEITYGNAQNTVMYYTGSYWDECTMLYYTGSIWEEVNPYYLNGQTWEECSNS